MHLAQKLRIKEGMQLVIRGAPEGYSALLSPLPDGVEIVSEPRPGTAFLQLFLRDLADLDSISPEALEVCANNSLLWITYPKVKLRSQHGLSRDIVRAALEKIGWEAVTIVAVDDVWAALRFKRIQG